MNSFRVGLFLAIRAVKHASKWTTGLIIFVMVLTFLNLIVVSGILVGLIQGSEIGYKQNFIGELGVSRLDKKTTVENADEIISIIKSDPSVTAYSVRYIEAGEVEANYKDRGSDEVANIYRGQIYGVDPEKENETTGWGNPKSVIDGEYLTREDAGKYILLGKDMVEKYSVVADADPRILKDTEVGSVVRVKVGDSMNEYTVKGITKIKAADVSQAVIMVDSELRRLAGKDISNVDQIAVRTVNDAKAGELKQTLLQNGYGQYAKIELFDEGVPAFVKNMKQLFGLLGNMFGAIGIVVAAVVIGIIVFINAINRRKQIGILKGIGIAPGAIKWSYVLQSIYFAFLGSMIGLALTYGVIKPFFDRNPIDFPFSDGVLVAELDVTLIRVAILLSITVIAGYIPARMIVKKNTLNAILGR